MPSDPPSADASLSSLSVNELLSSLASKTPAPGGGAAAGVAGATACGLASMVLAYSIGRRSLAEHEEGLQKHAAWFARSRELLMGLADEDARAYRAFQAARARPDEDPGKAAAVAEASAAVLAAPRATLAALSDVLRRLEYLPPITNRNLASDLAIAAVLAEGAAASAAWNVRVNLRLVEDKAERSAIEAETARMISDAGTRRRAVELACHD